MSVNTMPKFPKTVSKGSISPQLQQRLEHMREHGKLSVGYALRIQRELMNIEQPINIDRKLLRLIYGEPFQRKELEMRLRKHYKLRDITEFTATKVILRLLELGIIEIRSVLRIRNRESKKKRWDKLTYYELTRAGMHLAYPISYPPKMVDESLPSALQELTPTHSIIEAI